MLNGTAAGTAYGAGIGTDTLYNMEVVLGGSGNDTIRGDNLGDTLYGNGGNNSLYGGSGNDTLYGGAGTDILDGGGGINTVDYHTQLSSMTIVLNGASGGTAMGSSIGTDYLYNIEVMLAGSGNDSIIGSTANESLDGGAGINTLYYAAQTSAMTVNLLTGTEMGAGLGTDTLANMEIVVAGSGNDVLTSGSVLDSLYGGAGNDTLISGSSANAVLDGQAGINTLSYLNQTSSLTIALNGASAGTAWGAGIGTDTLYNFEVVQGGSGNDTFIGGGWSETIDGSGGVNSLTFAAQTSALTVNLGSGTGTAMGASIATDLLYNIEVVVGGSAGNTLIGGLALDSLYGGAGNDTFIGGTGNDVMSGGSGGIDEVYYGASTSNLVIALNGAAGGTAYGTGIGTDTLYNIEVAVAGSGNNTIIGNATVASSLYGGVGNDTISGGTGNDLMDGGTGLNVVDYHAQTSALTILLNGASAGTGWGANIGTDSLYNFEVVLGSAGNDTIVGNHALSNTLYGNGGNNSLYGGLANDTLYGGTGNDVLDGGAGGIDMVDYSGQTSALVIALNGASAGTAWGNNIGTDTLYNIELIKGGSGGNTIIGNPSLSSTLIGGAGNDTISGGAANDTLDGGSAGIDVVDYHAQTSNLTILLNGAAAGTASGNNVGTDSLYNFEVVLGSAGNDTIVGNTALSNTLYGNGGNNSLYGGNLADTFFGGTGSDVIDGKGGVNVMNYASSTSNLVVALNGASAGTAYGAGIGTDSLTNIGVVLAGSGNDSFIGSTANESFDGGGGVNTLYYLAQTSAMTVNLLSGTEMGAGLGTDTLTNFEVVVGGSGGNSLIANNLGDSLYGGAGNDTLVGGTGNDLLDGQAGINVLDYHSQTSALSISLNGAAAGTAYGANIGTDTLYNMEVVLGGAGNDTIRGDNNGDTLFGNAGNDTLLGGNGNDTLNGGAGNDYIDGGAGQNVVDYSLEAAGVTVNLLAGSANGSTAGTDTLVNIEVVLGSASNDTLIANNSGNSLYGNAGNDTLVGGAGNDILDGGTGINQAYYGAATSNLVIALNGAAAGTAYGGGIGTDTLYNIEVAVGGAGNDSLIANPNTATSLYGGAGNDTLTGGSANDLLDGGAGVSGTDINVVDYHASGAAVTAWLNGTGQGTAYGATIGTDSLYNLEVFLGGVGNDVINILDLNTSQLATPVAGMMGHTIDGGAGINTVSYSTDLYGVSVYLAGEDASGGALGGGTGSYTGFGTGDALGDYYTNVENVTGGTGNDYLVGSSSSNTILGGAGNDTISGLGGSDYLDGGSGTNWVLYSFSSHAATILLNGTSAGTAMGSDIGTDTLYNFENVLGGHGNDTIIGDSNNNIMDGGGGTDSLYGMAGNDTFIGGHGREFFDGGAGQDTIDYTNATSGITATMVSGTGTGTAFGAGSWNDTFVNVEIIRGSSNYGNLLVSTGGSHTLVGGFADDTLIGGNGSDTLIGNGGSDTFIGGVGHDTFIGGSGSNSVADYQGEGAGITADLTAGSVHGSGTWTDSLTNIEGVIGSSHNDVLIGGNSAYLSGGGGNDTLYGSGTGDTLIGGTGSDSIIMSAANLLSVASIDGGSGSAYLSVTTGMSLSTGASVISNISNIETIDLTNGGTGQSSTASLSYTDISQILGSTHTSSALTLDINGTSFYLAGTGGATAAMLSTAGQSTVLNGDTITLTNHTTTTYNSTTYTSDYYTYVHSGSTVTLDLVHH